MSGGRSSSDGAEFLFRRRDRKSTRLNSSHSQISYAVFCLKKKSMRKVAFINVTNSQKHVGLRTEKAVLRNCMPRKGGGWGVVDGERQSSERRGFCVGDPGATRRSSD